MVKIVRNYRWVFDDVELGIRIRERRQMLGMTQLELGKLVGFETGAVIAQLENGRCTDGLTMRALLRLTNWLDVDPCVCFALQVED